MIFFSLYMPEQAEMQYLIYEAVSSGKNTVRFDNHDFDKCTLYFQWKLQNISAGEMRHLITQYIEIYLDEWPEQNCFMCYDIKQLYETLDLFIKIVQIQKCTILDPQLLECVAKNLTVS
jgi:hypothetical protein